MLDELFKTDFKFKKSLGQNFISDKNFLRAMVLDADVGADDNVLEIGAGAGTLTEAISEKANKVLAIEKDESLKDFLQNKFSKIENVSFLFGDFLKISKEEIEKIFDKEYKIVANLPYYITTPIIFKIIEENFNAKSLTIMVQKEVAERLVAKPKTKNYGTITIKLNRIGSVKIVRNVSRTLFTPMPNVDSAIVRIDFNKQKISTIFGRIVDCAFAERRKILVSNLANEFNISKEQAQNVLKNCGIDVMIRGEALAIEQFEKIENEIKKLC